MECGNCGTKFSQDELVEIRGTNRYSNKQVVIAHECPGCGDSMSKQFTREQNTEQCGCSARIDVTDDRNAEVCTECGLVHSYGTGSSTGGIEDEYAIPASEEMVLQGSDADEYWYSSL